MARGMKSLKRSGKTISDQIWLGIQRYPTLECAADSISCVVGYEAVTAARLRRWIEKGPDDLGRKVHRLFMLNPGAIVLGEASYLQFQIQEALDALRAAPANTCIDRAMMRMEFALIACRRRIRTLRHQSRRTR